MELNLNILVLDDQPDAAKISIDDSLKPITTEQRYHESYWRIAIRDLTFTVSCHYVSKLSQARELLFNSSELQQYDLILLDNDWREGGGKELGYDGLKLLEDLSQAGIQHPFLAIYTQATGYKHDYIALALKFGARALIWKSETTHFINLLSNS